MIFTCSEEVLHAFFASVAAVVEVRIARDKFSAAPRGFAFVEFHSVADATRVLYAYPVCTLTPN